MTNNQPTAEQPNTIKIKQKVKSMGEETDNEQKVTEEDVKTWAGVVFVLFFGGLVSVAAALTLLVWINQMLNYLL